MRPLPLLLLATLAGPIAAQDTAIVIRPDSAGAHFTPPELPRAVALEVVRIYNAPTTTRLVGRTSLPFGNAWTGDVAIRNGPAQIAGRVEGSVLVINGNLLLDSLARISGEVLVVGGSITGPTAGVAGGVRAFEEPFPYKVDGDSLLYAPDLWRRLQLSARYTFGRAESKTSLILATSGTYNRVEGLPIVAGPAADIKVSPDVRFLANVIGVFRTAGSLSGDCCDLGFSARGEIRVGRRRPVAVAIRGYDLVSPMEDWGLHANEVGWAAVLFHRDYRDYYRGNGVSGRVQWQAEAPLALALEVRREHQRHRLANDPWSLTRNDEPWRANPPIDEGRYTLVSPAVTFDTRNVADNPTSGWYLRGSVEVGRSSDVIPQQGLTPAVRDSIPTDRAYTYTRGWFDLRRYTRLSAQGRLNLRFVLGGWLGGDPLPVQRRLSIGGPEPTPGYGFRSVGCNLSITDSAFAGSQVAVCDRVIALQAEYRGHVTLHTGYDPATGESAGSGFLTRFLRGPDVVVFGNTGQGWLVGSGPGRLAAGSLPELSSWIADLGLGVDWGGLGVYLSKAVTSDEPLRFGLRLEHRF